MVLEPLPETRSALEAVDAGAELAAELQLSMDSVVRAVPECVGLSISLCDADLTFTYLRSPDSVGTLDAVQYLEDGPCVSAIDSGEEIRIDDILDEDRWQLFALESAAKGVRSSLSLPLRHGTTIIGSVNLYAASANAFLGEEATLARTFGARVQDAVNNADLSMATLRRARQAPSVLADMAVVDQAKGILVAKHNISFDDAQRRLNDAATQAGITEVAVARAVVQSIAV
jgi:GAF domain-containing protein